MLVLVLRLFCLFLLLLPGKVSLSFVFEFLELFFCYTFQTTTTIATVLAGLSGFRLFGISLSLSPTLRLPHPAGRRLDGGWTTPASSTATTTTTTPLLATVGRISLEVDDGARVEELLPLGLLHRRERPRDRADLFPAAAEGFAGAATAAAQVVHRRGRLREAHLRVQPHPQTVQTVAEEVHDKHEEHAGGAHHDRLARLGPVEHLVDAGLVVSTKYKIEELISLR